MIRTRNTYTVAGGQPIAEDGQPCAEPGQPLEMIAYRSPDGTRITVTIETEEAP